MLWLVDEFGEDKLRSATVVLPTEEFFPDAFSEDEDDVRLLVDRVCGYMSVDPERVELEFFTDYLVSNNLPMASLKGGKRNGKGI